MADLGRVLWIDTSCGYTTVGMTEGRRVVGEVRLDLGRSQSTHLPGMVEGLFRSLEVPMQSLDSIGVVVGPGAYTGLRVGVCYAQGLAEAIGVDMLPVPTLDALAQERTWGHSGPFISFLRAKKGLLYVAAYDDLSCGPFWGPVICEPSYLLKEVTARGIRLAKGPYCEEIELMHQVGLSVMDVPSPSIRGMVGFVESCSPSGVSPADVRLMYLREPDFGPTPCKHP
ncbi:universal bacterial protein YeaZ [Thermanaerovibrio velox DSM 12556]|uniref:Universal bacterial protein YeaZ n=1 Tax=Thermanaerovibrio velox DSM 12556 TaxID=926567 RepID=H0URN1_9BACT|nr:tRNA (adenosine(37)-N6)-threonylcarbamoyltransferase complex dimerization subunit type 1 TsaB [Thermanaerovibrio velox]EHM09970.1 universal bacterial protein YeaZ [Thermanaerovibrio velox DSM 12556]